jgi:O-acetyl-ADP-ribose deacetylase (regulator of RNase III)
MVLLGKSYGGYQAGTIAQFQTNVETALIAQGIATASAGPVTAGAYTTTMVAGRAGIAAAGSSVIITNAQVTTESKIWAQLSNAAADATATSLRVTPANGSFTIALNAASTGIVGIDWMILLQSGETQTA